LRLDRCPDCGSVLRKTKKGNVYECPNPECPVIEVRFQGHGYSRVSIIRDTTMLKERGQSVDMELAGEKLKGLLRIIEKYGKGMFSRRG